MVVVVVLLIFITIGILYGTGMLQSVSVDCPEEKMIINGAVACNTANDCISALENQGVSDNIIEQITFTCRSGECYAKSELCKIEQGLV